MFRRKIAIFAGQEGPAIKEHKDVNWLLIDWTKGSPIEGLCELFDVHKNVISSFLVHAAMIYNPNAAQIYNDIMHTRIEFFMLKTLSVYDQYGNGEKVIVTDNVQKWESEP